MSIQSGIDAPRGLSWWFIIHFIVDISIAIPLFLFPERSLEFIGWQEVDAIMARVVAAALFGIGIESLLGRNSPLEGFRNMLNLKIIWSLAAILGIGWSMLEGAQGRPIVGWIILLTFVAFHIVWIYWRIRVGKLISGS